jgi:hypothetical protein
MNNKPFPLVAVFLIALVIYLTIGCSDEQTGSEQEFGPQELTMTKELRKSFTPYEFLRSAKEGNQRFLNGETYKRDLRPINNSLLRGSIRRQLY